MSVTAARGRRFTLQRESLRRRSSRPYPRSVAPRRARAPQRQVHPERVVEVEPLRHQTRASLHRYGHLLGPERARVRRVIGDSPASATSAPPGRHPPNSRRWRAHPRARVRRAEPFRGPEEVGGRAPVTKAVRASGGGRGLPRHATATVQGGDRSRERRARVAPRVNARGARGSPGSSSRRRARHLHGWVAAGAPARMPESHGRRRRRDRVTPAARDARSRIGVPRSTIGHYPSSDSEVGVRGEGPDENPRIAISRFGLRRAQTGARTGFCDEARTIFRWRERRVFFAY